MGTALLVCCSMLVVLGGGPWRSWVINPDGTRYPCRICGPTAFSASPDQEAIAIASPPAVPVISNYVPAGLLLQLLPTPHITVTIQASTGELRAFDYPCDAPCAYSTSAQVQTLITALNTANLTTRSLWRRVFDRLVVDFPTRFPGGATVQ